MKLDLLLFAACSYVYLHPSSACLISSLPHPAVFCPTLLHLTAAPIHPTPNPFCFISALPHPSPTHPGLTLCLSFIASPCLNQPHMALPHPHPTLFPPTLTLPRSPDLTLPLPYPILPNPHISLPYPILCCSILHACPSSLYPQICPAPPSPSPKPPSPHPRPILLHSDGLYNFIGICLYYVNCHHICTIIKKMLYKL